MDFLGNPFKFESVGDIIPDIDSTHDIGSSSFKYNKINSNTFNGETNGLTIDSSGGSVIDTDTLTFISATNININGNISLGSGFRTQFQWGGQNRYYWDANKMEANFGGGGISIGTNGDPFNEVFTVVLIVISDDNKKIDIEPFNVGSSFLQELKVKKYRMKNFNDEKIHTGLLAQDLSKLLKKHKLLDWRILSKEDDDYGISYEMLIPVLLNGLKENQIRIDNMRQHLQR